MRAVVVAVVLVGGVLIHLGSAPPATACSCLPAPDEEHFEHADAVFVGRVVDYVDRRARADFHGEDGVRSSVDPVVWVFATKDVYKGSVAERQGIASVFSGASCGLEIGREGEFLVFARREPLFVEASVDRATLYAGLCSREHAR